MFKIGEFSKLSQVSIRMLRYYDEMGLLKPDRIDTFTGYRRYSAAQLPELNKILYLRDSGFSVAEIAVLLKNQEQDFLAEQLERKRDEIKATIEAEKQKLIKLEVAKLELTKKRTERHYQVTMKAVPSYHVLSLRKVIPNYFSEEELWRELATFMENQKIKNFGQSFSIYHDQEFKEKNVDVELCVQVKAGQQVDSKVFSIYETEAVPMMACTMVYGAFSNIANVYLSLAEWLQEHPHYQMDGPDRQIVHRGPWNEQEESSYLTEIQIPLIKR